MKISELAIDQAVYTQLSWRVLAVLVRCEDGWCVYVDAVPGDNHACEWVKVLREGTKQRRAIAEAIAYDAFFPSFEVDLPYAC